MNKNKVRYFGFLSNFKCSIFNEGGGVEESQNGFTKFVPEQNNAVYTKPATPSLKYIIKLGRNRENSLREPS